MKIMQWATIVGMLAVPTAVFSQSKDDPSTLYSANRLIQECRATISDNDSKRSQIGTDGEHCLGYVQGFLETTTMWRVANEKSTQARVPMFCLNLKATNEIIIRKIPIWAIEHAEDTKGAAIEFLMAMLVGDYPCGK